MSELKPCPFCGKEELRARSSGVMNYYMECEYCGASGPVDDTDLASENEWNTRASPWISVEDRLPSSFGPYFVRIDGKLVEQYQVAKFSKDRKKWTSGTKIGPITEWMEIPA